MCFSFLEVEVQGSTTENGVVVRKEEVVVVCVCETVSVQWPPCMYL